MEAREISDLFDQALLKAGGGLMLDEYDKSMLLTEAQLDWVKDKLKEYNYGNTVAHILSPFLVEKEVTTFTNSDDTRLYSSSSSNADLSDDILAIVYERVQDSNSVYLQTVPLDYNELDQIAKNPFRKPNTKIAYRLISNGKFHIFSEASVANYTYTYCKVPYPIILEDFTALGLKIYGQSLPVEDYNTANPGSIEPVMADKEMIDIIKKAAQMAYMRIPQRAEPKKEN